MDRIAGRILSMLGGVSMPAAAWAQERPYDVWGMHPMWGMWGAWGFGMMLMMLVFLGSGHRGPRTGAALAGDSGARVALRYRLGDLAPALCTRRDRQRRVRS
jgi:hypothetical protein